MAVVKLHRNIKGVPHSLEISGSGIKGGEGTTFFSKDGKYAVKIYHRQDGLVSKRQLLEKIMVLGASLTDEEKEFLCWPVALVDGMDGNARVGCVTSRFPKPPYTQLIDLVCNPKYAVRQYQRGRSWANYIRIARSAARAVSVLNAKGCAHTDIDYWNFLANAEDGKAVMLDLDGAVVPGFLPPQVMGKREWMAPELVTLHSKHPSERTDRHSLAILVLHTLLFRNVLKPLITHDPNDVENDERIGWGSKALFSEHPKERANRPRRVGVPLFKRGVLSYRILTPMLRRLTEQAFIEGLHNPDKRPSAREWENALGWAMDELWRCSKCRWHFPYPHWQKPAKRRECPFCGERVSDSLPSVLSLYEPRHKSRYSFTGRQLVLGNDYKLFADVLDPKRNPPMTRQKETSKGHVEWDPSAKINRLINESDYSWKARIKDDQHIQVISRGASLPLQSGTVIHFGEGNRLAVVEE